MCGVRAVVRAQGTLLIIMGSTMSVVFGDHSEVSYSLHDLLHFYTRTLPFRYRCCSLVVVVRSLIAAVPRRRAVPVLRPGHVRGGHRHVSGKRPSLAPLSALLIGSLVRARSS